MAEHTEPQDPQSHSRLQDAIAETERRITDIDQRIARQRKRVELILAASFGPADEMQAVLQDMIRTRDLLQARLAGLRTAQPSGVTPATPEPNAVSAAPEQATGQMDTP